MTRGRFITLEGGEGTGKSTQVRLLAGGLSERGRPAIATREPGGAPGAEEIRNLLVTGTTDRWSPTAELLMMNAARDDHLRNTIRPALDNGTWVVCDRFADSSRAYQGIVGGVDLRLVDAVERAVVGDTVPDLTIVLDLDVDQGLARTHAREVGTEDRFERKGREFHMALREAFLDIAAANPDRCVVVDAGRPLDDVAEAIGAIVAQRFPDAAGDGSDG